MKSKNVAYLHGLDHLRALAAFMVLFWHSVHGRYLDSSYVPQNLVLGLLEEGHTGVSVFIVITGFIFTYILHDREIDFSKFLYNRFIRIFPLLFLVTLFGNLMQNGIEDIDPLALMKFFNLQGGGIVYGSWTLVIEFQFYLFFPIAFIYFRDKFRGSFARFLPFLGLIGLGMAFRVLYFARQGNFQEIAYWTIFGRIDQFMLGVLAALLYRTLKSRLQGISTRRILGTSIFASALIGLLLLGRIFNLAGGYKYMPSYPSPEKIWLVVPTIEGVLYAGMLLGWVLLSEGWKNLPSRFFAYLGSISYSTYLLHLPIILLCNKVIDKYQLALHSDVFLDRSLLTVLLIYPVVILVSALSFEFIERPFLSRRKKYILSASSSTEGNLQTVRN